MSVISQLLAATPAKPFPISIAVNYIFKDYYTTKGKASLSENLEKFIDFIV
jgi:hypothetical protein